MLAHHPVKSMLGEVLPKVEVGERGLAADRAWAVYTADGGIVSGETTRRFRRVDGLLQVSSPSRWTA
nr:MOSC N-terminal beta barrel domain-containing protein [Modestobacter sp. DSM 44400]